MNDQEGAYMLLDALGNLYEDIETAQAAAAIVSELFDHGVDTDQIDPAIYTAAMIRYNEVTMTD